MNRGAWPATVYGVTKSWARSETEHACMSWAEGGIGNGREAGFRSPSLNPGVGLGPGLLLERTTLCPIDWTDSMGEIHWGCSSVTCGLLASLLEKAMAPHSSTLAWKIPWMEEPGALQTMGSWRVGHDRMTSLSLFTFLHWRRKRQPTPVFLPGESQRQGAWWAAVYGVAELDTTEAT